MPIIDNMDYWNNILDEETLKFNVNFAAMFVLNYECIKDFVVSQIREFYCNNLRVEDDKNIYEETEEYKNEVRSLDKNIEDASLKWFINVGAINQSDYDKYQKIRQRRNDITHKLYNNLIEGFLESDAILFSELLSLYSKLDQWWINEIEIPIAGDEIPDNYDKNGVCGGQAIALNIINSIILEGKGDDYKDILKDLK